jgi:hypothetical protein
MPIGISLTRTYDGWQFFNTVPAFTVRALALPLRQNAGALSTLILSLFLTH